MRKISYIIIHHSVTGEPNNIQTARNIINNQKRDYEKGLISRFTNTYHYMITKDGEIVKWIPEEMVSGHCGIDGDFKATYPCNFNSIGICLLGNFEIDEPNNAQIYKLIDILKQLTKRYNIKEENILGHRDVYKYTDCPGRNLYKLLPLIRKEVKGMELEKWEKEVINFAYEKKWIKNLELHLSKAKEPFSRAETLAVLMNFLNSFISEEEAKELVKTIVKKILEKI